MINAGTVAVEYVSSSHQLARLVHDVITFTIEPWLSSCRALSSLCRAFVEAPRRQRPARPLPDAGSVSLSVSAQLELPSAGERRAPAGVGGRRCGAPTVELP